MNNNASSFKEILNWYLNLIKETDDLIFLKNKIISGVYLLYFSKNDISSIIPIYVGQSTNIANRIKQHRTALKKLVMMSRAQLIAHISSGKQDGNFLYAKIALFLQNNNLTIDDMKIKILESNINKRYLLLLKEEAWINKLQSEFFGFNQLVFIQLIYKYNYYLSKKLTEKDMTKLFNTGINLIDNFDPEMINYGYNHFNITNFIHFAWLEIEKIENKNQILFTKKNINQDKYVEFKNKLIIFTKQFNKL